MSVVERIKQRDPSPSAYLFSKGESAKHAPTRGLAAAAGAILVLPEVSARTVGGTVGAVKDALDAVTGADKAAKSPSHWLFKKAGSAEHGVTKVIVGTTGVAVSVVEFPLRAAVGTVGAVKRAAERVTRRQ